MAPEIKLPQKYEYLFHNYLALFYSKYIMLNFTAGQEETSELVRTCAWEGHSPW